MQENLHLWVDVAVQEVLIYRWRKTGYLALLSFFATKVQVVSTSEKQKPVSMATSFSSLPIIDLSALCDTQPSSAQLQDISQSLYKVFTTTGFAYLVNAPLSFSHDDVFRLANVLFRLPLEERMRLAKKTFVDANSNTYRGYFPAQPGQQDNLKEGFEVGPKVAPNRSSKASQKFNLSESNVWPDANMFPNGRHRLEMLHSELQELSAMLLSLLAISLGRPADFFASYLPDSVSTLRLLHYPPQPLRSSAKGDAVKLCCTPHTDSGILTLLHQDQTGGLEVLNAASEWVPAPYIPGSIVVNIGDLLAKVSGGRFVATMHRVRMNDGAGGRGDGMGRFSVPFFLEPGEDCMIKSVDGNDIGVRYGEHVRRKMESWVEFQDSQSTDADSSASIPAGIEAY